MEDATFCDGHHTIGDVPIPETLIVHRVRVQVDVLFAGVSPIAAEARTEALAVLERAVVAAGGVISVHQVSSCMVRYGPLPAVGEGRAVRHAPLKATLKPFTL